MDQFDIIKDNQQTDIQKKGNDTSIGDSHPTYYAAMLPIWRHSFIRSIMNKINEFMEEVFIYEGFPKEVEFTKNGVLGIVQPYFSKALEYRLATQGKAFIVKYGSMFYVVNATSTKWDKDNNTINYVIIEPYSPTLNGRGDLEFIEIRNNWLKLSDNSKLNTILEAIGEVWELMFLEVNIMYPKKIYNRNIIEQTNLNNVAMDNIAKTKKPLIGLSFKTNIGKLGQDQLPFFDFDFTNVTEPLIKKMDYYMKELYEMVGIPVNGSNDKKANLQTPEVQMKNLVGGALLLHRLELRKEAVELIKQKWPEFKNLSVKIRMSKEFKIFEDNQESEDNDNVE